MNLETFGCCCNSESIENEIRDLSEKIGKLVVQLNLLNIKEEEVMR